MREIKFRAKHKTTGEWWYGSSSMYKQVLNICPMSIFWMYYDTNVLDKETLGQYTGLHDKNGRDIYEGDLIANETGRICKVVWFQPSGQWDAFPVGNTINTTSMGFATTYWQTFVEVIGNIYENPELLE